MQTVHWQFSDVPAFAVLASRETKSRVFPNPDKCHEWQRVQKIDSRLKHNTILHITVIHNESLFN